MLCTVLSSGDTLESKRAYFLLGRNRKQPEKIKYIVHQKMISAMEKKVRQRRGTEQARVRGVTFKGVVREDSSGR